MASGGGSIAENTTKVCFIIDFESQVIEFL